MKRKQQTGACVTSRLKEEKSKYDSPLLTFEEFLDYMKIGRTTGRRLTNDPMCRYVVRIGQKVMIHKDLLDEELKRAAKYGSGI